MKCKKPIALALSLIMCLSLLTIGAAPAFAVKFGDVSGVPKAFWAVFTPYEEALGGNDSAKIASTGDAVIKYWLNGGTAEARASEWAKDAAAHGYEINSVWSTSRRVAEHYEKLGDITNSVRVNKISLAFVDAYKALISAEPNLGGSLSDMEFARTEIQAKINAYEVKVDVYAELRDGSGTTSYRGAKHEPKTGVYFGDPAGPNALMSTTQKPSATLIYVLYESEDMATRVEHELKANESSYGYSRSDYSVVEVAWNFKNEGATLASVPGDTAKITDAAKYLGGLGIPILLRVGAEMNVWKTAANPTEFIAAFRKIADIMHQNAPNVALVWSVNFVSAQGLNYDMFYPGDSYVDWVGISLYTSKYHVGDPNTSDTNAAIYGTGKYANPVKYMSELVKQYGSKKPIMISEGAVSLQNRSNSEDLTTWALPRIRQTYAYIPMLFPEVKAMFWFNVNLGEAQRWDFGASSSALSLYSTLTASDYFIGKGEKESPITYKKLGTATFPTSSVTLLTYAPYFTMDSVTVQYKLDGKWIAQSDIIPYRSALNLSGEADGAHKLSIHVLADGKEINTVTYNMVKSGDRVTVSADAITSVPTPPPTPKLTANPTASTVLVNGENKAFDAYNINDNNYFKLRDLAFVLSGTEKQFEVSWSEAANAISLTSGKAYTAVGGEMTGKGAGTKYPEATTSKILKDGAEIKLTAYNIDGNNYFKLRDIGSAFDFGVTWDGARNTIVIDTTIGYTP